MAASAEAQIPRSDVEAAVRALHGDAAKLVDFEVQTATSQGLCSFILRVSARVKLPEKGQFPEGDDTEYIQMVSFVVKRLPQVKSPLKDFTESEVFDREVLYITRAVPLLKKQMEILPIVQYAYASSDVIFMEDLSNLGFEILEINALEFPHVKLIMEKLAILHAASVDHNWLHILPFLQKDALLENPLSPFINLFKKACEAYALAIHNYFPETDTKITNWLVSTKSLETLINFVKPDPNNLNILSHGDFWINNIMIKTHLNVPIDVKYIDFQMCKFVPPSRDIFVFLYTCKDKSFREKYESELIRAYVESFNKALGCERLHLEEFTQEYEESRLFGVLMALVLRTMNCMPDIYQGEQIADVLQYMLSGAQFSTLPIRYQNDGKFNTMVKENIQELIQVVSKIAYL